MNITMFRADIGTSCLTGSMKQTMRAWGRPRPFSEWTTSTLIKLAKTDRGALRIKIYPPFGEPWGSWRDSALYVTRSSSAGYAWVDNTWDLSFSLFPDFTMSLYQTILAIRPERQE